MYLRPISVPFFSASFSVVICVQVPVELFEQFKAYLKQHGMTQKDFVIRCIQQALAEDAGVGEE